MPNNKHERPADHQSHLPKHRVAKRIGAAFAGTVMGLAPVASAEAMRVPHPPTNLEIARDQLKIQSANFALQLLSDIQDPRSHAQASNGSRESNDQYAQTASPAFPKLSTTYNGDTLVINGFNQPEGRAANTVSICFAITGTAKEWLDKRSLNHQPLTAREYAVVMHSSAAKDVRLTSLEVTNADTAHAYTLHPSNLGIITVNPDTKITEYPTNETVNELFIAAMDETQAAITSFEENL